MNIVPRRRDNHSAHSSRRLLGPCLDVDGLRAWRGLLAVDSHGRRGGDRGGAEPVELDAREDLRCRKKKPRVERREED